MSSIRKYPDSNVRKRQHPHIWEASNSAPRTPVSSSQPSSTIDLDAVEGRGSNVPTDRHQGVQSSTPSAMSSVRFQETNGQHMENDSEACDLGCGQQISTGMDESGSVNIFEALGRWSEAVRSMSSSLDRDACSSLVEEIARLQHDVASRRCTTSGASLRAFIECPLPALCSRILGDLDRFEGAPFSDHVTTILDAFACIQDPVCTGKNEMAEAVAAKSRELDAHMRELDAHLREKEKVREDQQDLAEETMRELEVTTDTLLNLHAEQELLQQSLREVRMKAAQQRTILENCLEKTGQPIQAVRCDEDLESMSIESEGGGNLMPNSIKRQQEKANTAVSAVQDHINLVYCTADFIKEAQICMGGLIQSMMIKSLQNELATLVQDQEHAKYLSEQLKDPPSGPPSLISSRGHLTPSIANRYKSFYLSQLRNMAARHITSRFAAEGLIEYLSTEGSAVPVQAGNEVQGDNHVKTIVLLAHDVISKLDELKELSHPDAQPKEVEALTSGSTVALCSNGHSAAHKNSSIASVQCAAALNALASHPTSGGRLHVRCPSISDESLGQVCGLVLALGGLGTVPADVVGDLEKEIAFISLPLFEAVDRVVSGRARSSICVVHTMESWTEELDTSTLEKCPPSSLTCVVIAILQARMRQLWLSKVAVLDIFGAYGKKSGLCMESAGIRFFSPAVSPSSASQNEVSSTTYSGRSEASGTSESCGEWKSLLESVISGIEEYGPDLVVVCVRCSCGSNISNPSREEPWVSHARKLSAGDWNWTGAVLERLSQRVCHGRLVLIWDLSGGAQLWHNSIAEMVGGMMKISPNQE